LCCKPVRQRLLYGIWGTEDPSGSRDEAPVGGLGRSPSEDEEFILNLIFFLHFPELNAAFTVILLLMRITTLINFMATLLTRLASGCCRCVTVCASRAAV